MSHCVDFQSLARTGLAMPVGTDLLLHERHDWADVLLSGTRLGEVVVAAARRYDTPLAFPLMDLTVEKEWIVRKFDPEIAEPGGFHFHFASDVPPGMLFQPTPEGPTPRIAANLGALRYVAERTDLVPVGMVIGPFSLATKLMTDPITPIFVAGLGIGGDDDEEVALLERVVELAEAVALASIRMQAEAGAKAIFVCEPAANIAYFSPKQLAENPIAFERFVMEPNLRLKQVLDNLDVRLIFHDCGDLTDAMVAGFAQRIRPAMLSLGSSRVLWDDVHLVPDEVVLYGNLPTKRFFSDQMVSVADAEAMARELRTKMRQTGHPFVLGSECDVLSVQGCESSIKAKVAAALAVARRRPRGLARLR